MVAKKPIAHITEPIDIDEQSMMLRYAEQMVEWLQTGERRMTLMNVSVGEVRSTRPDDKFERYEVDGTQVWTFYTEPGEGKYRFTRQAE